MKLLNLIFSFAENSPGRSPKQSPRQRRSKRATSSGEE